MEARDAIEAAKRYVELALDGEEIAQIRVEEIDYDDANGLWFVTLGLMRPSLESKAEVVANLLGNKAYKRSYKIFTIDDRSGVVKSMKMRQIENIS